MLQRLVEESENDVALKVTKLDLNSNSSSGIIVQGRGDLHLGILIEKMRREGFEMSVSPPKIIY